MEELTVQKLKNIGVLDGYNGFKYLVWILENYDAYSVAYLTMEELVPRVAKEFGVSQKAVLHNIGLVIEQSWNADKDGKLHRLFCFCDYMPTFKEFVATLIVALE